jgi:hypothetical protein
MRHDSNKMTKHFQRRSDKLTKNMEKRERTTQTYPEK